jgi:nucleoside-diphosphate-sugar epimerase
VARACIDANCALFHASTTSVYGTNAEIVAEDCPESELRPQSPYAATKLREERLLGELAESDDLRYAICRFGTICGVSPGMRFHTAVNRFCWQAATGRPLTVWSTALHQRRPYLDLTDAVGAIRLILRRNLFEREIFNVVSANLPVSAIVEMIRKQVPDATVRQVDSPAMNDYSYAVSISKIQRLGFEGVGSIADCISQTVAMLRAAHGLPLASSP